MSFTERRTFFAERPSALGGSGSFRGARNSVIAQSIISLDSNRQISALKALRSNIEKGSAQLSKEYVLDLVRTVEDDEVRACRRGAAKVLASLAMRRSETWMVVPYVERLMNCIEDDDDEDADVVLTIMRALVSFGHQAAVLKAGCGPLAVKKLASSFQAVVESATELIALFITKGFGRNFWLDHFSLQELVVALAHVTTWREGGMNARISAALCLQALVENGPSVTAVFYDPMRSVRESLVDTVLASDIIYESEQGQLLFGIVIALVGYVDRAALEERFPLRKGEDEATKQHKNRMYYSETRKLLDKLKEDQRAEKEQSAAHSKPSRSLRDIAGSFQKVAHKRKLGEAFFQQIWEDLDQKRMKEREFQEHLLDREQAAWQQRQNMGGLMRALEQHRSDGGLKDPLPNMKAPISDIAVVLKEAKVVRTQCFGTHQQIDAQGSYVGRQEPFDAQGSSVSSLRESMAALDTAIPEWLNGFEGICISGASKLEAGNREQQVVAGQMRSLAKRASELRLSLRGESVVNIDAETETESEDARHSIQNASLRLRKTIVGTMLPLPELPEEFTPSDLLEEPVYWSLPTIQEQTPKEQPSLAKAPSRKRLPKKNAQDMQALSRIQRSKKESKRIFNRPQLDRPAQEFTLSDLLEEPVYWSLPTIQGMLTGLGRYPQLALVKQEEHHAMGDERGEWHCPVNPAARGLERPHHGGVYANMNSVLPRIQMVDESTLDRMPADDKANLNDSMMSAWMPASKGHRHPADAPTPINWSRKGWHRKISVGLQTL